MAGYGQFCPVAKTSELLCERWVPLIVRELLLGSRRFSDIQRGIPLISPTLLTKRLRQLEAAGAIERVQSGRSAQYSLTEAGWELYPIIEAMGVWGQRWVVPRASVAGVRCRQSLTEDRVEQKSWGESPSLGQPSVRCERRTFVPPARDFPPMTRLRVRDTLSGRPLGVG